jgi:hypothetical protein
MLIGADEEVLLSARRYMNILARAADKEKDFKKHRFK